KPKVVTATSTGVNVEIVFWDSIKASRDPADFRAYVAQFPKGVFVQLAQNRLAMLQQGADLPPVASLAPPIPPDKPAAAALQDAAAGLPATSSPLHDGLLARFAALSVAAGEAERRARDYEGDPGHKAIAVAIKARLSFRSNRWPTDEAAVTSTLERCQ